jgi:D-glycero-alpha-D-manno-heptose-7-phosphate kinase
MEIRVSAPNRVDLAGGTTDIYPLYLMMGGGCTVNVAVTVSSGAVFRENAGGGKFRIASEDLGCAVQASDPDGLPLDGPLGLICRAVRVLPPPGPVEISTRNEAPEGSGLGASSALLMAVLTGLQKLRGEESAPERLIDLAADIETASIGVLTGKQDYVAACLGGVSLIDFGYGGFKRRDSALFEEIHQTLEGMIVLVYTGAGRFSGMNNWEVSKAFIDNRDGVRENLSRIRDAAIRVVELLTDGRIDGLAEAVNEEWAIRRTLAPGVTTPAIEAIIAAARKAGAVAGKVCGAGGGGCLIVIAPPERRAMVERAIVDSGGLPIAFSIDRRGVDVR